MVETTEEEVVVLVLEEKWAKAKMHIGKMVQEVVEGKGYVNFKDMEKRRGFLVYVTRTYPSMVPYLKGIHLTLDSWRPQRDADGWKDPSIRVKASEWEQYDAKSPPKMVKAVPRLESDLRALQVLTAGETPPRRSVRSKRVMEILYGFGDGFLRHLPTRGQASG